MVATVRRILGGYALSRTGLVSGVVTLGRKRLCHRLECLAAGDQAGLAIDRRYRDGPGPGVRRGEDLDHRVVRTQAHGLTRLAVFRSQPLHHDVAGGTVLRTGRASDADRYQQAEHRFDRLHGSTLSQLGSCRSLRESLTFSLPKLG